MGEGTFHLYWAEYNIPFLVNQSEGVLPLGGIVLNPDIEVSEEFGGRMIPFKTSGLTKENRIRDSKFSLFYNLVVGEAVRDLDDIEKGEISSPNCESSFAMQPCMRLKRLPSDFFLSPADEWQKREPKTGTIPLLLPSSEKSTMNCGTICCT